jgi:hypothetical protein
MKLRAPLAQILARILLLAICFGALAPSVSQWLHPVKVLTAAVCGKDGLKNISLIPAEEQKPAKPIMRCGHAVTVFLKITAPCWPCRNLPGGQRCKYSRCLLHGAITAPRCTLCISGSGIRPAPRLRCSSPLLNSSSVHPANGSGLQHATRRNAYLPAPLKSS